MAVEPLRDYVLMMEASAQRSGTCCSRRQQCITICCVVDFVLAVLSIYIGQNHRFRPVSV